MESKDTTRRKSLVTYSSPGEALVYRELVEQKKRETELRRHWLEMGYELQPLEAYTIDDIWVENGTKIKSTEKGYVWIFSVTSTLP
jgi:hypothetical protein